MQGRAGFLAALAALVLFATVWTVHQLSADHGPPAEPRGVEEPTRSTATGISPTKTVSATDTAGDPGRQSIDSTAAPEPVATPDESVPSCSILARIVDEHGNALANATMWLDWRGERLATVSDADGKASLTLPVDPRRRSWASVTFEAEGRAREIQRVRIELPGSLPIGDVVLHPAGSVSGTIVAAGRELIRAQVRLCTPPLELTARDRERIETLGRGLTSRGNNIEVEADGSFTIEHVAVGPAILMASDMRSLHTLSRPFEIEVGGNVDLGTLILGEARRENLIEGVVLDDLGTPSANRPVELWQPGVARNVDPAVKYGFSDETGRFRFVVPSSSTYHLVLMDKFHGEEIDRVEDVASGSDTTVLNIPPQRFLDIHVRVPSGEPVEEARFSVADAEGFGMRVQPERTERGIWRLEAPARPFQFWVHAPGYEYWSSGKLDPEALPERIECVLEAEVGSKLHGIVTLEGRPLPGVRVLAYRPLDGPHRLNTELATELEPQTRLGSEATGEDGAFEMLIKEDAELILVVMESVSRRYIWRQGPLAVRANEADLRCDMAIPAFGAIEGNLLFAEGRELLGQVIGIGNGDGNVRSTKVGADGAFRFEALPAGRWQVRLITEEARYLDDRRAYRSHREPVWDVDLAPGETARFDIDLRHEAVCKLRGKVKLAPDGPSDWSYSLHNQRGDVDETGYFEAEVFGPGVKWLVLWASYSPSITMRIIDSLDLPAGESEWSLDRPTAELELTGIPAFDPDAAREVETELLRLTSHGPNDRRIVIRVTTHTGGPLLLRGLPAGKWTIEARWKPDGSPEPFWRTALNDVVLKAGEHRSIAMPEPASQR